MVIGTPNGFETMYLLDILKYIIQSYYMQTLYENDFRLLTGDNDDIAVVETNRGSHCLTIGHLPRY